MTIYQHPIFAGLKGTPIDWREWQIRCRAALNREVQPFDRKTQGLGEKLRRADLYRLGFLEAAQVLL